MAITKVSSGVISANAVTATIVAENVITSSEIATNGVGTLQIADDAVTSAKLDTNIDVAGTLDVTGVLTADSNVVIAGNLTVNGSTVTNSATNTTIEDALIELGTGTSGTPANDAGIIIERGDSNNAFMGYDESADKFIVATTTATGASTGNLSLTAAPLVTGALTASGLSYPTSDGSSAQVLQTDGSGNLSFATVVTGGAVVHNYTATGDGSTATFDTGINPQDEVNTWVHIDGVYQNKSEYSYNGSSITFSTAPDSGAAIDIITGTQSGFSTADSVLGVYSTTTTDTDTYDTGLSASTENNVNIFIEGVYQPKSTYTWSGSTITFDANTPTGLALEVIASKTLTSGAVVTGSITDSAVTTAKIADNAITSAKIVNNSITGADISATTDIVANTFTGALTGNVTGNVTGNLTGTIQTAAQTNITSVGTLSSLTVGGNFGVINTAASDYGAIEVAGTSGAYVDLKSPSSDDYDLRLITTGTGGQLNAASGSLALQVGSSTKLAATSSGVAVTGIITATDSIDTAGLLKVGVNDTEYANNYLRFKSAGAGYIDHNTVGQDINFRISNSSALDTTIMTLDAGVGSVGINQPSPSSTYKLDVGGAIRSNTAAPGFHLRETDASNQHWTLGSYGGTFAIRDVTGGTYPLYVETGTPSSTLYLDSAGNVGINETSPDYKLHISGSGSAAQMQIESTSSSNAQLIFRNTASAGSGITGGFHIGLLGDTSGDGLIYHHHDKPIRFYTNAANTMTLTGENGMLHLNGRSGAYGYAVPQDEALGYTNNLNAGAFGILHRGSYDSYVTGNTYYYKSGGSSGWRAKYGAYKSTVMGMVNGAFTFDCSSAAPGSNGASVSGLASRVRIDSDGLKFGSDTAAANALDNYEEGTWSPQVYYQNSTDQANATNVVQDGKYTKIGNLVFLQFRLDFSQSSSSPANDNIGVKNLPFSGAHNHYAGGGNVITSTTQTGLNFQIPQASTSIIILVNSANVGNFGNEFGTGSNKYIRGSVTYLAQ